MDEPPKAPEPVEQVHLKEHSFALDFIAYALAFAISLWAEPFTLKKLGLEDILKQASYQWILQRGDQGHFDELQVCVVDLSPVETIPSDVRPNEVVTRRDRLASITNAFQIANSIGVAIDVDMSTHDGLPNDSRDPLLFERWSATTRNKQKPFVLVGVGRSLTLGSPFWDNIRGHLGIPHTPGKALRVIDLEGDQVASLPFRILQLTQARGKILPSTKGVRLASLAALNPFFTQEGLDSKSLKVEELEIDPALIKFYMHNYLTLDDALKQPELVTDKIVVLGDCAPATFRDAYAIPGVEEPVPGVALHAAAAQTLIDGGIAVLKAPAQNAVAFLIGIPFIGLRRRLSRKLSEKHYSVFNEALVALLFTITALILSWFSAHYLGILWTGAMVTLAGTLIAPLIGLPIDLIKIKWTSYRNKLKLRSTKQ